MKINIKKFNVLQEGRLWFYLPKREDSFLGQSGSTGLDRWEMRASTSPQSEDNDFVDLHIVTKRKL